MSSMPNSGTAADMKDSRYNDWDPEKQQSKSAARNGRKGSRIDAPRNSSIVGTDTDSDLTVGKQVELEAGNAIKYRTCSWQKTAALLFSEYICLAIMSFPWSYSYLGLVGGLILTVVIAGFVLYTSLIVWEFCMRHPELRDVCDVALVLFKYKWTWWFTAVMFLLNNTFIMGFHCLTGAIWLNTVSKHGICSIGFSAIIAVISWFVSMPRTFSALARIGTFSAVATFISVLLATIFAGIQDHPAGYPAAGEVKIYAAAPAGTDYVSGMNAFMNIAYTFIGQITLPSFIAEMEEPRDFPKALWAVTIAEIAVFSICGAVTYAFIGTNYITTPAFGSLGTETYRLVSFSFMVPTIIFLGVLYASVSARFIFFNAFKGTRHLTSHTLVGWASWAGILALLWVFAFIIAEVIPFFSYLLSLMSALFDSFFGWIFWGTAYLRMRHADYGPRFWAVRGARGFAGAALNVFIILVGFYFLTAGTYASVKAIIDGYASDTFGGAFTCEDTALAPKVGTY